MPDIKIKPTMDKPKVLERNHVPKDAESLLKQQYEERKKQRELEQPGGVGYAIDQTEGAAKHGTVIAGMGTRRAIKQLKRSRGQRSEQVGESPISKSEEAVPVAPYTLKTAPQPPVASSSQAQRQTRYPAEKEMTFGSANRGAARASNSRLPVRRPAVVQDGSFPKRKAERGPAERSAMHRMRQVAQRKAHQKALRQTSENTGTAVRSISRWTAEAAAGVSKAAAAAVNSMSTTVGGTVLLIAILLLAAIGGIAASPFGILFAGESTGADAAPVSCAVAQVNDAFNERLEELQTADAYDDVTIQGEAADWVEVLAVFASKVAGSGGADADDVVTLDADRIARLQTVFLDMSEISSEVERIERLGSDPDDGIDDSWTEKILHITITPKSAADMPVLYGFTIQQISAMNELIAQRELLQELIRDLLHVSADAANVLKNLPDDLTPERRAVVEASCSLVGKVNYFWGGKSHAIGWDSRWGTLQKVTADGSSTTGTYRPYGMDCSGYVDWVFNNALGYVIGHGGGAHSQHTYCKDISWNEAQIGDLVFYPNDEHIGIVAGWDKNGNILIIHCASSYNSVVVTGRDRFIMIAEPNIFSGGEGI